MKGNTKVLLLVFSVLCFGLLIYATTRTESLYLNQWLGHVVGNSLKDFLQNLFSLISIPSWMIYSLPDALWMLALILVVMMIWDFKLNRRSIPWIAGAFCAGILFEVGQSFHLISGTFDFIDLISISIGALIPVFFTLLNMRLCKLK